eukprot:13493944-Ditylum_brightwellii.AAC.1
MQQEIKHTWHVDFLKTAQKYRGIMNRKRSHNDATLPTAIIPKGIVGMAQKCRWYGLFPELTGTNMRKQ